MPPLAATVPPQTITKPVGQKPAAGLRAERTERFAALLTPPSASAAATPAANTLLVKTQAASGPVASPSAVTPTVAIPVPPVPAVVAGAKPATAEPAGQGTKTGKADAPPKAAKTAGVTSPATSPATLTVTSPVMSPATPVASVSPSDGPIPVSPPIIGIQQPADTEPDGVHVAAPAAGKPAAPGAQPAVPTPNAQAGSVIPAPPQTEAEPLKPPVASVAAPSPAAPPGIAAPQVVVPVSAPPHAHAISSVSPATNPVAAQIEQPARQAVSFELAGSGQKVSVSLHPAELGRIDVQVARDPAGVVQVTLTADRPETAAKLAADQPALHAALDRAGVAPERVVTVQAAPLSPDATGFSPQAGGGQGDHTPRQSMPSSTSGSSGASISVAQPAAPARATMRLGLDITA